MPNPVPDWYPDPYDPSGQRWWDGLQWTAHTRDILARPAAPAVPNVPFATQPQYAPAKKQATTTRLLRLNVLGFIGVAASLLSVIVDVLGVISIPGIVLTSIGLARDRKLRAAGETRTGTGLLVCGLILSCVMFLIRGAFAAYGLWEATQQP